MKKNASKTVAVKPRRPSAQAFWRLADDFRQTAMAAHAVLRQPGYIGGISGPLAFLYFRSLELACKSCLPKDKYTDKRVMKEFGHKISALLDELEKNGTLERIRIDRKELLLVDDYSDDYSEKWIEYSPGWTEIPDLDLLSRLVERFVEATRDLAILNH